MSLEDETITQKTRVFRIELEKQKPREKKIIECPPEINMMMTATVKRQRDG